MIKVFNPWSATLLWNICILEFTKLFFTPYQVYMLILFVFCRISLINFFKCTRQQINLEKTFQIQCFTNILLQNNRTSIIHNFTHTLKNRFQCASRTCVRLYVIKCVGCIFPYKKDHYFVKVEKFIFLVCGLWRRD